MPGLKYMPAFRARQQEMIVLQTFEFEDSIYPLIEIVKEYDRVRKEDKQKNFADIYIELIKSIKSERVFIDLPVYLCRTGATNLEVVKFMYKAIDNWEDRVGHLSQLFIQDDPEKIIPVISSYLLKTGEGGTIEAQFDRLAEQFQSIAFRLFPQSFQSDIDIVEALARPKDFLILDIGTITPFPKSPPLKPIVQKLKAFTKCKKILLHSAINTEIQNVLLEHGQVVFDADNSHTESYGDFGTDAFGDYCGIKKDDLTAGGGISPGFIYYDAIENQYYGFKANIKGELSEFENTIVPDVLACEATKRMLATNPPYLVRPDNRGYDTLNNIQEHKESGKSQAKFKRIAMEHYLYCIRQNIRNGEYA